MALTKEEVLSALRSCVDPEIPVNIVDLGLIYHIDLVPSSDGNGGTAVSIRMTLTSAGCPMSQSISNDVHRKLLALPGVSHARVEIVWEPQWSPERITPEGRRELQLV